MGLAVGDAVGTTVEFSTRGTFEPLYDMVGGGPFNLNAGQWTEMIHPWHFVLLQALLNIMVSTAVIKWSAIQGGQRRAT